ncbi:MAG: cytoplasmic protein [Deltaproteobacteria bacterium]|nr:MAG: cytoplasmic protein [Deltaproteobacteria bacterium]
MRITGQVIRLCDRSYIMLKSELVSKNPLRAFDQNHEGGLAPGQTGLIAARAGTGKTAMLIQIALDNLFRGNTVLHVSIGETVSHVQAWYEEIYRDLALGYDLEMARSVWEEAVTNRLILTFRNNVFSVDTLKERLSDLIEQNIFSPRVVLIDGVDLHKQSRELLDSLRTYTRESGLKTWVATRTHREDGELNEMVAPIEDLFDVIVAIEPNADGLSLSAYKNPTAAEGEEVSVILDPKTLLLSSK